MAQGSKILKNAFLSRRFFTIAMVFVLGYVISFFFSDFLPIMHITLIAFAMAVVLDFVLLFRVGRGVAGTRKVPERLSNGDNNPIIVTLQNTYPFSASLEVIDEIPYQFQVRDKTFLKDVPAGEEQAIHYQLRPVERGVYGFGRLNVFAQSPLGLVRRRFQLSDPVDVPVYPSFLQMRSFEIMAASNRLSEVGVKKIRRIGQTMEFERIKEYVVGDDPRRVNWPASARRGDLMVNEYQDERAQPLYCLINAGRVMELPFDGLTLLDYSINASLVIGNVALKKHDKVGLMSFSNKMDKVLRAEAGIRQLGHVMEHLYSLETDFQESDYKRLYSTVRHHVSQRSLLLLFTNFESMASMDRQLPYLKALAKLHLLVVIFFENTELTEVAKTPIENLESVYVRTIASQMQLEKEKIVVELRKYGIQSILTRPEHLSVNTLNKYLELKARRAF